MWSLFIDDVMFLSLTEETVQISFNATGMYNITGEYSNILFSAESAAVTVGLMNSIAPMCLY